MSDPNAPAPSGAPEPQLPPAAPIPPQAPAASGVPAPAVQPAPPVAPPQAPQTEKKQNNVLALVAMIVGVIGFIFACVPGALIVGWVLLPIAFILGIVSLFLKGNRKWMGIVAIALSVVGTIVGVAVFFAVVSSAVDEAFGDTESTVTQQSDEEGAADEGDEAADAAQGTRDNPYPLNSEINSDEWTVVINSYKADGNAVVAAGDYNDAPPAGSHYEVINYTVTYKGDESGLAAEASIAVVTGSGNVINSYDNLVILNDGFGMDELYAGASATGSEAFLVPDGESVLLRVRPGLFADEVFVKP